MKLWFEGGAGGSGETPGDAGAEPAAVADPEGGSGADEGASGGDAAANAENDRQAYIAELVQKGIEKGVEAALARFQPAPGAPAATPPTASRGVAADMEREAREIAAENTRLDQAFETQGATAQNLVAQNRLAMRLSNFNARLLAHGMNLQEQERQVDGAARGDDKAKETAWKRFAADNAGVPIRFLRATFEKEYAEANPAPPPKAAPKEPVRPVDVSGGGGGGVKPDKIRTVSRSTYSQELEAAEERGDVATVSKMGRDIRAGRLKITG